MIPRACPPTFRCFSTVTPVWTKMVLHPQSFGEFLSSNLHLDVLCKLSDIVPTTNDGSWPQEAGNLILKMVQDCDGFLAAAPSRRYH